MAMNMRQQGMKSTPSYFNRIFFDASQKNISMDYYDVLCGHNNVIGEVQRIELCPFVPNAETWEDTI